MATAFTVSPPRDHRLSGTARGWGWWRPVVLMASILVAYAAPLATLVRAMGYDTPIAYLGLVPPIAFALGYWLHHRTGAAPAQLALVDVVAGGMLLMLAALVSSGLPILANPRTWAQQVDLTVFPLFAASAHLDLLSLPVFAAGMLVLL